LRRNVIARAKVGRVVIQRLREISPRSARTLTRQLLDKFAAADFFEELLHKN
jgi:hypothetical protein